MINSTEAINALSVRIHTPMNNTNVIIPVTSKNPSAPNGSVYGANKYGNSAMGFIKLANRFAVNVWGTLGSGVGNVAPAIPTRRIEPKSIFIISFAGIKVSFITHHSTMIGVPFRTW